MLCCKHHHHYLKKTVYILPSSPDCLQWSTSPNQTLFTHFSNYLYLITSWFWVTSLLFFNLSIFFTLLNFLLASHQFIFNTLIIPFFFSLSMSYSAHLSQSCHFPQTVWSLLNMILTPYALTVFWVFQTSWSPCQKEFTYILLIIRVFEQTLSVSISFKPLWNLMQWQISQ